VGVRHAHTSVVACLCAHAACSDACWAPSPVQAFTSARFMMDTAAHKAALHSLLSLVLVAGAAVAAAATHAAAVHVAPRLPRVPMAKSHECWSELVMRVGNWCLQCLLFKLVCDRQTLRKHQPLCASNSCWFLLSSRHRGSGCIDRKESAAGSTGAGCTAANSTGGAARQHQASARRLPRPTACTSLRRSPGELAACTARWLRPTAHSRKAPLGCTHRHSARRYPLLPRPRCRSPSLCTTTKHGRPTRRAAAPGRAG